MIENRSVVLWEWEYKEGGITKVHNETIGGDGYVHLFDCGDGYTAESICQNSSNCTV